MNLMTSIRKLVKGEKASVSPNPDAAPQEVPNTSNPDAPAGLKAGFEFLEGMSTGTARFIIDRKVSDDVLAKYEIQDMKNKGRYYLAKIVNPAGDVVDTVLIDKQNRSVHFQKGQFK
jgi:hypothetical protein